MFIVYGPGQDMSNLKQGMVSIFLEQSLKHKKIQVKGSLERYRDLIYITDVVELWYRATLDERIKNQIINIGTGIKTTVRNLLDEICDLVAGADYYEDGTTQGDQNGIYADNSKILNLYGNYEFASLRQGLHKFHEFCTSQ